MLTSRVNGVRSLDERRKSWIELTGESRLESNLRPGRVAVMIPERTGRGYKKCEREEKFRLLPFVARAARTDQFKASYRMKDVGRCPSHDNHLQATRGSKDSHCQFMIREASLVTDNSTHGVQSHEQSGIGFLVGFI